MIALTAAHLDAIAEIREEVDPDLADGELLYLAGGANSQGMVSVSLVRPGEAGATTFAGQIPTILAGCASEW